MDARSMKQPAHVGSIHIIESLLEKGHASKTGARLREVLEPLASEKSPITVHFHHPCSKRDVLACLTGILSQSLAENRVPMLHLETHGAIPLPGELTSRGLVVESGELLTWRELVPLLTAINAASRLNLVVFTAACYGADLATVIQPLDRAPVRLIFGPKEKLTIPDVERATTTFYRELFRTRNLNAALDASNAALDPNEMRCWGLSAEFLFLEIMRGHYRRESEQSDAEVNRRAESTIDRMPPPPRDAVPVQREQLAAAVRARLRDPRWVFDEAYRRFFFLDTQPENATRFNISLEDCLPTQSVS
jgi:hypothetical protein